MSITSGAAGTLTLTTKGKIAFGFVTALAVVTGAALTQPFSLGGTSWSARMTAVALIPDDRLAALSGPDGEMHGVVPLVTLSVATAY